jgi:hypothetical protein
MHRFKLKGLFMTVLTLMAFQSANPPVKRWYTYTGFIGKYPIGANLYIDETPGNKVNFSGTYFYVSKGIKINLSGDWYWGARSMPSIQLTETSNGKVTGSFSLLPEGEGYAKLKGTWNNPGGSKTLNVTLTEVR